MLEKSHGGNVYVSFANLGKITVYRYLMSAHHVIFTYSNHRLISKVIEHGIRYKKIKSS